MAPLPQPQTLLLAAVLTTAVVSALHFVPTPIQLYAATSSTAATHQMTSTTSHWRLRDTVAPHYQMGSMTSMAPEGLSKISVSEPEDNPQMDNVNWAWAMLTGMGATLAYLVGSWAGQHFHRSPPLAMMATSGSGERDEWDKRVSVLDQDQFGQNLKYVSEDDYGNLLIKFVQERYGEKETERVVKSFRMTERGEEFRKVHGPHPLMKQIASSYVEGLSAVPCWPDPVTHHPWAKVLQEGWETIRAELDEAIKLGDEGLKQKGSISWMGAQGGADSYGTEWKTLGLCDRGYWDDDNTRIFKNTCRILRKSRAPIMECFFAKMPAHTEIKPHSDYTNFVLTAHLGLKCPEGKCWINTGDTRNEWKDGGIFLLDTTFLHEAFNTSDEDRYVLIMRLWHPELTATEIEAISFLFDCLDDSDIILHPDGMAMYDMMKAHRIMEWNAILGPGDTDEECEEILRKLAEEQQPSALEEATKMSTMVKEKLKGTDAQ